MEKENLRKVKYPHQDEIPAALSFENLDLPRTEEGLFHEFVTIGDNIYGIVEAKDGTCHKIPSEFIQFIDEDKPLLQESKEPKTETKETKKK